MKKLCLFLCVLLTLVLFGCEKAPAEQTVPTTVPVETTAPIETTPPTTLPPETVPPETTEPVVLEFPEGDIQAVLLYFADMLYVRDAEIVETLPEGYYYVGKTFQGDSAAIPKVSSISCHIPSMTDFYASPTDPDYIFFSQDGQYRRMIRAALVQNTWTDKTFADSTPENYTQLFFQELFGNSMDENFYNTAAGVEFRTAQKVDLHQLFYNGFADLRQHSVPLTDEETAFLLKNGFGESDPLTDIERFPEDRMDAVLQRFFGLGLSDTSGAGLKKIGVYHKDSRCYYGKRTDTLYNFVTVDHVEYDTQTGNYLLTITCDMGMKVTFKMVLQPVGDVLRMVSNMPA